MCIFSCLFYGSVINWDLVTYLRCWELSYRLLTSEILVSRCVVRKDGRITATCLKYYALSCRGALYSRSSQEWKNRVIKICKRVGKTLYKAVCPRRVVLATKFLVPRYHVVYILLRTLHISGAEIAHLVQWLVYGLHDRGIMVRFPAGAELFQFPPLPNRLWGPLSHISNGFRGFFLREVKRPECGTGHLHPSTA
jgi:hypothetical protein